LKHCIGEFVWSLNLRHVTTIIDNPESRIRDLLMKPLAEVERDEFVVATP
jgi:hypothetical protein